MVICQSDESGLHSLTHMTIIPFMVTAKNLGVCPDYLIATFTVFTGEYGHSSFLTPCKSVLKGKLDILGVKEYMNVCVHGTLQWTGIPSKLLTDFMLPVTFIGFSTCCHL